MCPPCSSWLRSAASDEDQVSAFSSQSHVEHRTVMTNLAELHHRWKQDVTANILSDTRQREFAAPLSTVVCTLRLSLQQRGHSRVFPMTLAEQVSQTQRWKHGLKAECLLFKHTQLSPLKSPLIETASSSFAVHCLPVTPPFSWPDKKTLKSVKCPSTTCVDSAVIGGNPPGITSLQIARSRNMSMGHVCMKTARSDRGQVTKY